jgi:hypothetical protein
MPIKKIKRGSGVTKRKYEQITVDFRGPNNPKVVEAFRDAVLRNPRSLGDRLAEYGRISVAVLSNAHLPTRPGLYRVDAKGKKWKPVKKQATHKGVRPIADALGFAIDSREGFAARVLDTVDEVRQYVAAGNIEDACINCIRLGSLLMAAELKDGRADGPARGGKSRAANMWGGLSPEEGAERDRLIAEYMSTPERQARGHKMKAYKRAAEKFKTSVATVRRAVRTAHKTY